MARNRTIHVSHVQQERHYISPTQKKAAAQSVKVGDLFRLHVTLQERVHAPGATSDDLAEHVDCMRQLLKKYPHHWYFDPDDQLRKGVLTNCGLVLIGVDYYTPQETRRMPPKD